MTLDTYLSSGADTATALAQRCGISTASVSRIRRGGQNISLALARTIERETKGAVTVAELAISLDAA